MPSYLRSFHVLQRISSGFPHLHFEKFFHFFLKNNRQVTHMKDTTAQIDNEAVGRRIRSWMVDAGVGHEETARRVGVPVTTFRKWLYGERRVPFDSAFRITRLFNKSLDELACYNKEEVDDDVTKVL